MEDDEEELCCATALSETARAAVRRVRRRERWEGFWGTMTIRLTDQVYGKRGLDSSGKAVSRLTCHSLLTLFWNETPSSRVSANRPKN